jgi:cell wall-associated NlpC family hydrolase
MGATGPDYFDCSGFTQKAFKDVYGINLPRTSQSQYFVGSRVSRIRDLEYGDLVFFNITGRGVSHVGIYLDQNRFAHASSSLGVTISDITIDYWKKRFIEGRRVFE